MGMGTELGATVADCSAVPWTLEGLFRAQYVPMVRAARVLLHDPAVAEETVQEAFARLHERLEGLAEPDRAVAYLRSTVLNLARSQVRHLHTARRHLYHFRPAEPTDDGAGVRADQRAVIDALRQLPTRQRECLVLRYYLDLSEADIAAALGVSVGSVKTHASRGLAALSKELEP